MYSIPEPAFKTLHAEYKAYVCKSQFINPNTGNLSDGKVVGNKITAVAKSDFQGQAIELGIRGTVDGDSIEGTLSAPMIPTPLEFKGSRG